MTFSPHAVSTPHDLLGRLSRLGLRALRVASVELIGLSGETPQILASSRDALLGDDVPSVSPWLAREVAVAEQGYYRDQLEDRPVSGGRSFALAGIPVADSSGRVVAVLCALSADTRNWTAEDSLILADLASAMAAELARSGPTEGTVSQHSFDSGQMDAFLGTVSHDLRSPITTIRGHAQMLRRRALRMAEPDGPRLVQGLESIDAATRQMVQMLNELVESASPDAIGPDPDRLPTDLIALMNEALAATQERTVIHELRLVASQSELVCPVNPERILRLFDHLLDNAIRYSPEGGPVTMIVEQTGLSDQTWVTISIQDRGLGIPAQDLPHVFDRYRRGSNVSAMHGTGVGLTNAQRIVQQHQGTISVESVLGQGTLVSVCLPLNLEER